MRTVTRGLCTSSVVWFSIPVQADSGLTVSVKKSPVPRRRAASPASPSLPAVGGTAEREGALPPLSGPRKLTKACYSWLLLPTTLTLRLQLPPPLRCQARKQTSSSVTCCNFRGWSGGRAPTGAEGGRRPLSHPSVQGRTHLSACSLSSAFPLSLSLQMPPHGPFTINALSQASFCFLILPTSLGRCWRTARPYETLNFNQSQSDGCFEEFIFISFFS